MATLESGETIAVPITCRRWDCEHCAQTLKRRLMRRLKNSSPNLFITLTTSTRTAQDPTSAYFKANESISLLIKRWRRKFPNERVEYFLVWERTKAGWPHAHVLLSAPRVSKHWLSAQWKDLTGSYIVDLQQVHSHIHAARYLAKYLTKDPQVPAGQRKYRRSAAFFHQPQELSTERLKVVGGWRREPWNETVLFYQWVMSGYMVDRMPNGSIKRSEFPARRAALMASAAWGKIVDYIRAVFPELLRGEHRHQADMWAGEAQYT